MGKKSSPDTPDVKGAAAAEGEYSRETARDQTYADRPDQYNPFGNLTWQQENVIDPATGQSTTKWTQRENMSGDMQDIYNKQMATYKGNAGMAAGMQDRVNEEMGAAVDWNQFGGVHDYQYDPTEIRDRAESDAYTRSTNRLDPQFEGERQQLEIQLRNRGLNAGDQQYQSEMDSFNTGKNDAYEQARLGATGEGRSEADMLWGQQMEGNDKANALRQQQIQEYIAKRQFSLGEQQALDNSASSGVANLVGTATGGGK